MLGRCSRICRRSIFSSTIVKAANIQDVTKIDSLAASTHDDSDEVRYLKHLRDLHSSSGRLTAKYEDIVEETPDTSAEIEFAGDHEFDPKSTVNTQATSMERFTPITPIPASKRKPASFLKSYTLAPFVNDSELLRNLVDIGVRLSELEEKYNAADFLVKMDWEKDVKPVLKCLAEFGVPLEKLGEYITANPWILTQSVEDLHVRRRYLQSKKFSDDAIARIINNGKYWLNFEVKIIDGRLGELQKTFHLSGDEVRFVVTKTPKIITLGMGYNKLLMFLFEQELGFNKEELKGLLVKDPKLWISDKSRLTQSFDYLHNKLGFSHQYLLTWPNILRLPKQDIERRHKFLQMRGRAQYDPEKPNYISLHALGVRHDVEFVKSTAKATLSEYNRFLKSQ